MATTVTKTIGTSSRDYSSIQAFFDAVPSDLVAADELWEGVIYPDSGNTVSTSTLYTGTKTTDATRYVRLKCATGYSFTEHANKATNALRANSSNGVYMSCASDSAIIVSNVHLELIGLQLRNTNSGAAASGINSSKTTIVRQCIIDSYRSNMIGSGSYTLHESYQTLHISRASACIYNGGGASGSVNKALGSTFVVASGTVARPILIDWRQLDIKDCAFFGFTQSPYGSSYATGSSGNATDLASWPHANVTGTNSLTYSSQFEDIDIASGTHDFRVKADAAMIGDGVANGSNATDIIGTTRSDPPTPGAWEYVEPASTCEFSFTAGGAVFSGSAYTGTSSCFFDFTAQGATFSGGSYVSPVVSFSFTAGASVFSGSSSSTYAATFTTEPFTNNTGTVIASTAVDWTWFPAGAIGSLEGLALKDGSGTTDSTGSLTATGLPSGAGFILATLGDGSVYFEEGTAA